MLFKKKKIKIKKSKNAQWLNPIPLLFSWCEGSNPPRKFFYVLLGKSRGTRRPWMRKITAWSLLLNPLAMPAWFLPPPPVSFSVLTAPTNGNPRARWTVEHPCRRDPVERRLRRREGARAWAVGELLERERERGGGERQAEDTAAICSLL